MNNQPDLRLKTINNLKVPINILIYSKKGNFVFQILSIYGRRISSIRKNKIKNKEIKINKK